ncbi:Sodium:dicarboxylate symporter [Flavobacterium longum]|uniref:dicarboxylate/amino acid:cation symporter n=1 Tax=Flavobacterium longum TaxID=1299340 RepID=UPI0039ECD816
MSNTATQKKSWLSNLTVQIILAMLLGAGLGIYIYENTSPQGGISPDWAKSFSTNIKLLATIFIRLVQMIISPLVFTTLVVGIAKLGDIKSVGRIGGKALAWFFTASFISLLIGMFWVNMLQPGVGLKLANVDMNAAADIAQKTEDFSAQKFIEHIIPKSVVEAMATNEILQIVVFSIFFGLAAASIGDMAKPVVKALDKTSHIILKMVGYVMKFAPLGVFGAIASVLAIHDLNNLVVTYVKYFGSFMVGIASLWVILLAVGFMILKKSMVILLKRIVSPLFIAFGTTSSEAVFPKLTEELERFGVKDKVVSFMLPLGYSFNLDGSMMYMTFASIFIAQAYGIDLSVGTQMTMLLVLMLTSKGIAGVPRASLVVVAATCGMFKIPVEGIALILPIDHFCDMFRSATNVLGNALATSVIGKYEADKD